MKIAIVHNRSKDGVICKFGRPCAEKYSLKHVNLVARALHRAGHTVWIVEADKRLLENLEALMPADRDGMPTGLVFNMAYGIQGNARYTHVPGMLEMAGIPYTGSSPLGHGLSLDKVVTKVLLRDAGVPTPKFAVMRDASRPTPDLRYPLIVKPRHESTSYGLRLVHHRGELAEAVKNIVDTYHQDALVEEYIDGREVCVGLLGNQPVETLPVVELSFAERNLRLMTFDDKYHKRIDEPEKICPADLPSSLLQQLNRIAKETFHACHVLDYGRVDIRISPEGKPYVLEINSMASLGTGGSYVYSALATGRTFESLVEEIVSVSAQRYGLENQTGIIPNPPASRIPVPNLTRQHLVRNSTV